MSMSPQQAERLYGIDAWGSGYFRVTPQGHLAAHVDRDERGIDLYSLLGRLKRRRVRLPVLLRFPQILASRVNEIFDAFDAAIREFAYEGVYRGVFPIKVNQQRDVVDELVSAGRKRGLGLEAGSKAELAVALAQRLDPNAYIICNGYKDKPYIRLALRGVALGKKVFMIVEKPQEISLIIDVVRETGLRPLLGMRMRLRARGSGKWEKSGGYEAKFGLSTQELLDAVGMLREAGLLDCFQLLHFHVGSQIPEIRRIKDAVREGARVYAKLIKTGCSMQVLDVGGGLGVDYDGSRTSYEASMNYTVQEYANDVVYNVQSVCEAEEVPMPDARQRVGSCPGRLSRHADHGGERADGRQRAGGHRGARGRARERAGAAGDPRRHRPEEPPGVPARRGGDAGEPARALRSRLPVAARSRPDRATLQPDHPAGPRARLGRALRPGGVRAAREAADHEVHRQLQRLPVDPRLLGPGSALPVRADPPPQRKPTVRATLCDVTCDSDGEVDRFPDLKDVKDALDLHALQAGKPYYLAILLIGAYQDVLGDYHNLFGRVDEANVKLGKGGARVTKVVPGDDADDVLRRFQHDPEGMVNSIQEQARQGIKDRRLTRAEANEILAEYREALEGYTYLDFAE